jgi:hypothetical protein
MIEISFHIQFATLFSYAIIDAEIQIKNLLK